VENEEAVLGEVMIDRHAMSHLATNRRIEIHPLHATHLNKM
jgi:hypothetical protein